MRYTPWIVSQHVPDSSTLENLVHDPRFAGKAGQDLAIALWQFMVDRDLGIFHYFPAQEPFWGKDLYDPVKVLNVYGFTICHVHANTLGALAKVAGFPVRLGIIRGHEGTEIFYDGKWHYLDADIQMFYRLRPPHQDTIASREDLYRDSSLVDHQPNPSYPYHMPDRLPEQMRPLYEIEPAYLDILEERIHSMDYRLRPGERMTRYFHHCGRWVVFPTYPASYAQYPRETGPEGPTERFWPRRQWGNGLFTYAPKLSSKYRDVDCGADELAGLDLREDGLTCPNGTGHAVFAFESPYIYCGIPDPMRRLPSVNGATVQAAFTLPPGTAASIEVASDTDWQTIWSSDGRTGEVACKSADFTALVDSRYRARMRFTLQGPGATLRQFQTQLWFMVSPHSLPALRNVGPNRMRLHSGDAYGLNTRTMLTELMFNTPESIASAHTTVNLRHDPAGFARLLPADPAQPWQVIYKLAAPDGGQMAWAAIYTIIEGRKPGEPYDGHTATIEIADSPDGPWRKIAEKPIAEHPQGWHFGLFGQDRFAGDRPAGYVRLSARKGALGVRIAAHYVPARHPADVGTLEIEHAWYEDDPAVGRRLRTHTERTDSPSHEYAVTCKQTPHDEYIALSVPSLPAAP